MADVSNPIVSRGRKKKGKGRVTTSGPRRKQVELKMRELKIQGQQELLPGILDRITIDHIAPKLPWDTFHSLLLVSCSWKEAIRNHEIYNARVRSNSTQTLVAFNHMPSRKVSAIALYWAAEGRYYKLPAIPRLFRGVPWACKCIPLDGRLYVFGGMKDSKVLVDEVSTDLYVLDVAGLRGWKKCARMQQPREFFGCGLICGKIYVFGGHYTDGTPVQVSEVYDPKEDAWSSVKSKMPSLRNNFMTTVVGEELFLHGGVVFSSDYLEFIRTRDSDDTSDHRSVADYKKHAVSADVFHPVKDKWRTIEHFTRGSSEPVFMVGGELQKITSYGIEVYDVRRNSWKPSQFFVTELFGRINDTILAPLAVIGVDDEILALVAVETIHAHTARRTYGAFVMRSRGFGIGNKTIVWKKLEWPFNFPNHFVPFLLTIQL